MKNFDIAIAAIQRPRPLRPEADQCGTEKSKPQFILGGGMRCQTARYVCAVERTHTMLLRMHYFLISFFLLHFPTELCARFSFVETSPMDLQLYQQGKDRMVLFRLGQTRSSAIAERPRCSLFKLWQKYKCEKRASNIALCYGVNVDKSSFYCSTAPCLYLMQN